MLVWTAIEQPPSNHPALTKKFVKQSNRCFKFLCFFEKAIASKFKAIKSTASDYQKALTASFVLGTALKNVQMAKICNRILNALENRTLLIYDKTSDIPPPPSTPPPLKTNFSGILEITPIFESPISKESGNCGLIDILFQSNASNHRKGPFTHEIWNVVPEKQWPEMMAQFFDILLHKSPGFSGVLNSSASYY